MSVEEVFKEVSAKMIEGVMFHDQMTAYFAFLGLDGFSKLQEYRYFEESATYRKISAYFISHYNKLIEEKELTNSPVIPDNWYGYTRQDVDTATRRNGLQEAFDKWIAWETDVKALYERSCDELYKSQAMAAEIVLEAVLRGVDDELKYASELKLNLDAGGYDLAYILEMQEPLKKKYGKKVEKLVSRL